MTKPRNSGRERRGSERGGEEDEGVDEVQRCLDEEQLKFTERQTQSCPKIKKEVKISNSTFKAVISFTICKQITTLLKQTERYNKAGQRKGQEEIVLQIAQSQATTKGTKAPCSDCAWSVPGTKCGKEVKKEKRILTEQVSAKSPV